MRSKEGWEPLCDFLDVEIPDKPFPHLNDSNEFRRMFVRRLALAFVVPVSVLTLLIVLAIRRPSEVGLNSSSAIRPLRG